MSSSSHIFPQSFIREVVAGLSSGDALTLTHINLSSTTDTEARVGAFLDSLYSRAPSEVLRKTTPAAVCEVVKGCLGVLTKIPQAPHRIALELHRSEDSVALFLALDDHPFIITSIAERLYEADIAIECFQHPILRLGDTPIALSYLAVNPRFGNDVEAIIPRIREALESLKHVVRDHKEMISFAQKSPFAPPHTLQTDWAEVNSTEGTAFLDWLASGSFFFIGVSTWGDSSQPSEGWGVWKVPGSYRDALAHEIAEDLNALAKRNINLSIRKLRTHSIVHRKAPLLHIVLRNPSSSPTTVSILGYLTSRAHACEAMDIPLLRDKLRRVLAVEETPPNSHDYKYVIEVIDNMPTDDALTMPIGDLRAITQLALGVYSREDSRSASFIDAHKRRALTVVVLPPERYSAEVQGELRDMIESHFGAFPLSSEIHLDSSKKRQLRLYVSTPLPRQGANTSDLDTLGRELQRATLSWTESLMQHIESSSPSLASTSLEFPNDYQAAISIPEACEDYSMATSLSHTAPLTVSLFTNVGPEHQPTLTFMSLFSSVSLSKAVPVLQNIGLEVLDANSYTILRSTEEVHVLKCVVQAYDGERLDPASFNTSVAPGLVSIISGDALDDPLNILLRSISVSIAQISLLRSYCALLWQTYKIATKRTMWKSLAAAPEVAQQLLRMFDLAFNPAHTTSIEERKSMWGREEAALQQALRKVQDITYDRILRALSTLVKHTVRTNFYTTSDVVVFKIASQRVDFMPHPRPLFEIFVFSSRIEGTHLRSAKVSRGGIRWSERLDDYRSEILGLMKTQKVKNVIIVPSGAKGGFIVKNLPAQPDAIPGAVATAYREYITALLSITDNKVDGRIIPPPGCIVLDDPDPYLVVAADKGTATFSDLANSIAINDFQFWLGDAFASGGSAGYSHKKYGITARGAWECVLRHCKDIGVDTRQPFTTIGIGDMSGDVFGNAMILNESMSLIAAFNHKHIFIDPKPNNPAAFTERLRLFQLPRSQWSDFNASIISEGGGIFDRHDKEITISPHIREALAIPEEIPSTMDGETLISHILRAPVDIVWNGGIGTYVKARSESHSDVNDGANDNVRINADELRARIIGEGGNLGLTQKARVEFALRGGRINTDAIDNSGGVDLSDHEVNLKLLFSPLVANGTISLDSRNKLLEDVANDVVAAVLRHNSDQALMLSISQQRSIRHIDRYRYLIREMHRLGFLDRNRDGLPDELELDMRAANKTGLTRPELAVCSAAVKMWIKDGLQASKLCTDARLQHFVADYFPERIQRDFRTSVLEHPLRHDIIASEMIGEIIPALGISSVPTFVASYGASIPVVMKCLMAADTILGADQLRSRLKALDVAGNWGNFSILWADMGAALRRATGWLLQYHGSTHSLAEMVELYQDRFLTLRHHARNVFAGAELARFEKHVERYQERGVSDEDAILFSLYRRVAMVLEILHCARTYSQDVKDVASAVACTLDTLRISVLFPFENSLETTNKWEQELITGSFQEMRRSISEIAGELLLRSITAPEDVVQTLSTSAIVESLQSTVAEVEEGVRRNRPFQVPVLPVVARQLRVLTEELAQRRPTR